MERCKLCQIELSDGWSFDGSRVMRAIDEYIDDWFAGRVPDEVLTHQLDTEKLRREAEAKPRGRRVWKHG